MYRIKVFKLIFSPSGGPLADFRHARPDGLARLASARTRETFAMARGAAANKSEDAPKPVRGGNTNEFESWEEAPNSRVQNHGSLRTLTTAAGATQMPPSKAAFKTPHRHRAALFLFLFAAILRSQTPDGKLKEKLDQYKAALDKKAYVDSTLACAAALRLAPANADAQNCAAALKDQVNSVANAGKVLQGAGEFERALDLCSAVLVLNPLDKDAPECAKSARTKIVTYGLERSKLEQAKGYLAIGDSAHAEPLLGELVKSESPDVLSGATQLQTTMNLQKVGQATAKQRASIRQAELQIADGKREAAATTLKDVLTATNSKEVAQEADELLKQSKTSWPTVFRESLRAAWIMQFLAALLMVSGAWILLHWIRDLWRWGYTHIARGLGGKPPKWTFAGVEEDEKLGARDPILDALRRVPNEVRKPVWTPTRLVLYPGNAGWEVWEDFAVDPEHKAEPVHEPVFRTFLQRENDDKLLADAFQNVQFTVGTVGGASITKFWTGLVEWWHAGEPSFSASARETEVHDTRNAGDGQTAVDTQARMVVVRISASGPEGVYSALASTRSEDGCDAISLSAGRAAYKLLFRMNDDHTAGRPRARKNGAHEMGKDAQAQGAQKRDTAEQVDAHAAFRQGANALSGHIRSVQDAQADRDRRNEVLREVIENLEFVRHTFNRDPEHRVYYLESLRMQAIAYALVGRETAAIAVLEELEDATTGSTNEREQQIELEAIYNQAILHWKRAGEENPLASTEATMANILLDRLAGRGKELLHAESVWQLAQLARVNRRDWPAMDPKKAQAILDASRILASELEDHAQTASGADRRHRVLLAQNIHRYYAIAQLRLIAAFALPVRGPFARGAQPLSADLAALVENSLACFARSDSIGPASASVMVTRAYGALLRAKFSDAERLAKLAVACDAADQYAQYLFAESVMQRKEEDRARQYLAGLQPATFDDAALVALAIELGLRLE